MNYLKHLSALRKVIKYRKYLVILNEKSLTAHLEARAAFEPQLTPSPRTIIAEFFLATMAKESEGRKHKTYFLSC